MTASGAAALSDFLAGGDRNSAFFREMMDALPVAVYTTDAAGRLTWFNPAAEKLSGRAPRLGADKWCVTWKLFLPDGTPLAHDQSPMALALRGVPVPTGIECIAERPDGSRFWFTPNPVALRDTSGHIVGAINLLLDITDRKSAELDASEYARIIVETTPECVKIVARDGTLLFMNAPGLKMIGASSRDFVIGKSVYELIAPEDEERFRAFHERICGGEKDSLKFHLIGLDGGRRLMESHAAPLRHTDGSIVHLAITRDITQRARDEHASLLMSAIVDSSDDAIISKDLNGIITSWNPSAQRLFGYTAEEAVGRSVAELLIPDDRQDEEPQILARLRLGERVDHFETVRRRRDGSLLDISLTVSPVKDRRGRIVGASKIARDISDRRHAEKALLTSEARFKQLANAMPQIVWTARPDGSMNYFNDRWYEFIGLSREESGVKSWERFIEPGDFERTHAAWAHSLRSGEAFDNEFRLWDGEKKYWRWFVTRAVPVRDSGGAIVRWFGTCTDIDEQKRVQTDLQRANEDLEQFAFSASHDLQEPLRSVKIYTELLSREHGALLTEDAVRFIGYVRSGATRMENLVHDLLAYTQVTRLEAPAEAGDPNKALHEALSALDTAISEAGAQIDAGPLPDALPVHRTHLQQLFQNLIGNAVKYRSPERVPVIRVGAERQSDRWIFSVADNGIGIESEYKENIFGLFKRLHTSDEYSGTGIGLAICQRIVDRYNGQIWVESEPGKGSIFRFALPV